MINLHRLRLHKYALGTMQFDWLEISNLGKTIIINKCNIDFYTSATDFIVPFGRHVGCTVV